jgi:hypothetical protein
VGGNLRPKRDFGALSLTATFGVSFFGAQHGSMTSSRSSRSDTRDRSEVTRTRGRADLKAQIAAFSALPTLPILTVSALAWATATLDTAAA